MGSSSSILSDQEVAKFIKLDDDEDNADTELPVPPEGRKPTDKKGFVIFALLILILLPFLIYTLVKSDIRRLIYDHDSCGNFCGIVNEETKGVNCSGKDFTQMPYAITDGDTNERKCVICLPGGTETADPCVMQNSELESGDARMLHEAWEYTLRSSWKFLVIIIVTISFCLMTLILFRYAPGVIVWGVIILSLVLAIIIAILYWCEFAKASHTDTVNLIIAIVTTGFTIVVVTILWVLFKKIPLITLLYKETTKAIFAKPAVIFVPVITLFIQLIILVLMVVTTVWMYTAAELTMTQPSGNYDHKRNKAMEFTMVFNTFVALWGLQFLIGCQFMVISGSIAQWFFKKNQAISPISVSFRNTVRYHLGTIAVGSSIITLTAVIKSYLKIFISNYRIKWLGDSCCSNVEEAFLKFMSKNAYVETAIYGQSFVSSGKRAAKLLMTNAGSVIALNSVGDFVLVVTQFILLVISTAIAYSFFSSSEYAWFPTTISFFVNLIIVVIVFAVFETTVDTLFLCFCEDKILNDGVTRPYYMSTGLMQFVENSKKCYDKERK